MLIEHTDENWIHGGILFSFLNIFGNEFWVINFRIFALFLGVNISLIIELIESLFKRQLRQISNDE